MLMTSIIFRNSNKIIITHIDITLPLKISIHSTYSIRRYNIHIQRFWLIGIHNNSLFWDWGHWKIKTIQWETIVSYLNLIFNFFFFLFLLSLAFVLTLPPTTNCFSVYVYTYNNLCLESTSKDEALHWTLNISNIFAICKQQYFRSFCLSLWFLFHQFMIKMNA